MWECDLCKTMSISKIDERNRALRQFAKQMETEFPSRIFEDLRPQYRPLNYLIESVVEAKCFINIVAESIDKFFVGLLAPKLYQKDMAISIIIWHPQRIYRDLRRLWKHSILLKGYADVERPFTRGIFMEQINEAHQKLIVIDGLVAFYGSANATLDGWSREGEMVRFTTDMQEIQELNRNFYARFMAKKRVERLQIKKSAYRTKKGSK